MNWSGLQTVLAAQVATIAGCPAYWRDVTAQWEAWPRVFLSVVSTRKLGQDETRTRFVSLDDVLLPRVYGGRVVTVQIQVETRDQNLAASAGALGEQIRTRLGRLSVLDALRAVDVGVSTTTDVRTVNRTDDKARVVSYAVFEAVLLTHVSDEETDDADFGYIETVEITQTIDPVQDALTKTYLVGPQEEEEEEVMPFTYSYSGTYQPEAVFSDDGEGGTTDRIGAGPLGVFRLGSGAGVPSAGDTVRVFGRAGGTGLVNGETMTLALPFTSALSPAYVLRVVDRPGSDVTWTGALGDAQHAEFTATVTGDTAGEFEFELTYQTANAVDP